MNRGIDTANALGNLAVGPVPKTFIMNAQPTTWQYRLLGAKYFGWAAIALTIGVASGTSAH